MQNWCIRPSPWRNMTGREEGSWTRFIPSFNQRDTLMSGKNVLLYCRTAPSVL